MAFGASILENELVAFVEGHPETFNTQDITNLRRTIIASFALMEGIHNQDKPGVGGLARTIINKISEKLQTRELTTSQDVQWALVQFELCVEVIHKFLTKLCLTERSYNIGGYSGTPTPQGMCGTISETISPPSSPNYIDNIYSIVKRKITEYHSRVLKLWAEILIHERRVTPKTLADVQAIASAKDGTYEQKMRELYELCFDRGHIKSNLDGAILIEFLMMCQIATVEQMRTQIDTLAYPRNLSPPPPLSEMIFAIVSKFVPSSATANRVQTIPQRNKRESVLNVLHLTCIMVAKPPPSVPLPIMVYLSSDTLDQCVQTLKHFPTVDQFKKYTETPPAPKPLTRVEAMRSRMLERRSSLFEEKTSGRIEMGGSRRRNLTHHPSSRKYKNKKSKRA